MTKTIGWTILFLAFASVAPAQLVNENLLVSMPEGYKIDHQAKQNNMAISEMVPKAESVKNWTEMVTVQIFFGMKGVTPQEFKARIASGWLKACAEGSVQQVSEARENGYPALVWMLTCPTNKQTGKPEWTWFKAIQGNDSFYVVQKAFRFEPSQEQVVEWTKYLRRVSVCDSRRNSCPKTN